MKRRKSQADLHHLRHPRTVFFCKRSWLHFLYVLCLLWWPYLGYYTTNKQKKNFNKNIKESEPPPLTCAFFGSRNVTKAFLSSDFRFQYSPWARKPLLLRKVEQQYPFTPSASSVSCREKVCEYFEHHLIESIMGFFFHLVYKFLNLF